MNKYYCIFWCLAVLCTSVLIGMYIASIIKYYSKIEHIERVVHEFRFPDSRKYIQVIDTRYMDDMYRIQNDE